MCKAMKILITITTLIASLTCCGSKPVDSKPARNELVGEWNSTGFPAGFVRDAGGAASGIASISIKNDGSFSAIHFPQRDPYRYVNLNTTWELADPSITPSGSWSIEAQGEHLQCRKKGSQLILRYTISGKDNYSVEYKKAE